MAAARKGKKRPEFRERKWTNMELRQFAIMRGDDNSELALTLETLALKKSANIHVYLNKLRKSWMLGYSRGRIKRKTCQRIERKAKTDKHIHSEADGEIFFSPEN